MKRLIFIFVLVLGLFLGTRVYAVDGTQVFTSQTLSSFDGKNGHPAYFAYEGKVYDVTKSSLWQDGNHYGLHAGTDLTGQMANAPHGTEVFAGFPVMGTYDAGTAAVSTSVAPTAAPTAKPVVAKPVKLWYERPIRIAGLSILGWSGILVGILFVLNFATCFALPWSQLPLPWKGTRPGADALDAAPTRMRWTMLHKYFAWATVVVGMIHGILGFMQMLGKGL